MQRSNYRSIVMVMIGLAVATLTGFLRQSVIAYTLGAERQADIFLVAFSLPEFIYIALPIVIHPVVIPVFLKIRKQYGEIQAWRWGARYSGILFMILVGTTVLAGFMAPVFIPWLSPGFQVEERAQAIRIFSQMLPGLLLMGGSTLVGAFLQVYRHFTRPAFTTAIYNSVFVASLLVLPVQDPLSRAAWGVTLGAAAAFLFQIPLLVHLFPSKEIRSLYAKEGSCTPLDEALRLTAWMALGYSVHHLIQFIDRAMATSLGEGSTAVIYFAYHLALTVGQLSGIAVSTVMFPTLSEMIGNQQQQEARNSLNLALGLVLILSVPMTIALIAFRSPIVRLLFEHGAFTNEATNEVGQVLIFYALAVFADAICQPFWRVVYALRGGRTVVMVNAVQTLIRLTINLLMIPFLGYNGLSVSAFIGLGVQAVLLAYLAYKNLNWRVNRQMLAYTGQVILIGVIALAGVWLSNDWLLKIQPEPSPLNYLLLIGSLFFVAYTGILVVVSKPYRIYQEALRGN